MEIARMLLKTKCRVNMADRYGWTALHIAALHNDIDFVKTLLFKGANINAKESNSYTPLALARKTQAKEVCYYLRKHGAKEFNNFALFNSSYFAKP